MSRIPTISILSINKEFLILKLHQDTYYHEVRFIFFKDGKSIRKYVTADGRLERSEYKINENGEFLYKKYRSDRWLADNRDVFRYIAKVIKDWQFEAEVLL